MAKQETTETETYDFVEPIKVADGVWAIPLGEQITDEFKGIKGDLYEITYGDEEGFSTTGVVVDFSDDVGEPFYRAVRYTGKWLGTSENVSDDDGYETLEDAAVATFAPMRKAS